MNKKLLLLFFTIFTLLLTACSTSSSEPVYTYENHVEGYKLTLPGTYDEDTSLQGLYTRLVNDDVTVEIYHDDFEGTFNTKDTYFNYGYEAVLNNPDHEIIINEREKYKKYEVNHISWKRPVLSKIQNDKNYYQHIAFAVSDTEVVTVVIKSAVQRDDYQFIKKNFKQIDKTETSKAFHYDVVEHSFNEETQAYYEKTFLAEDAFEFGIFDAMKFTENQRTLELEENVEYKFNTLLRYQNIGDDEFPMDEMVSAYNDGRTVEVTMQSNRQESIFYNTLDGKYDAYLQEYIEQVVAFGKPILFRLNNEMNGDWVYYSNYHNSNDPELYVESWKYIYNMFEEAGADNVIWVWNPNHHSKPNFKWNHTLSYYPGSEYVDVVGLTAYNTGTYYPGEEWMEFETLYDEIYYQYEEWFDHPFMITEFSSSSVGGDKVEWIHNMFDTIDKYERVKLAILWSWQDFDTEGNPARIYLVDENEDTIEAFKKGFSNY